MPLSQPPQPLHLPLALAPHRLLYRSARLALQRADDLGPLAVLLEPGPLLVAPLLLPLLLLLLRVRVQVVERVVERVGVAQDARDAARGVALDLDFADLEEPRVVGLRGEGVGGGVEGGFVRGRRAACCLAELGDQAEAGVVLGEGFLLVPGCSRPSIFELDRRERGNADEPVLRNDVVAQGVERLLPPVGHGHLCARRAPLALLKFATHCV